MSDLGEPKTFLGMNIERDRKTKTMIINQKDYIKRILEKYGFADSDVQSDIPMVTKKVANHEQKEKEQDSNTNAEPINGPYREMEGSLLYLAGSTRPDISYAMNILSRYQTNPTEKEYIMAQRVFEYLKRTSRIGLRYHGRRNDMTAYSDSSFEDCKGSK